MVELFWGLVLPVLLPTAVDVHADVDTAAYSGDSVVLMLDACNR